MPLKDKIYETMHSEKLFNQTKEVVAEKTFRAINPKWLSKEAVKQGIEDLIKSGEVIVKNGVVHNNTKLLEGTFTRQENGSGYIVSYENGLGKQYYVPQSFTKNARSGDVVSFLLDKNGEGTPVGRINGVVSSSNRKAYGMVEEQNGKLVFLPEGKEFEHGIKLVQNEHAKMAVGKRCYGVITNPRRNAKEPVELKIEYQEAIFGLVQDPMSCVYAKLDEYGVTPHFSKVIEDEVAFMQPIDEQEILKRRDLRDKAFIAIDPPTCKDRDDALYKERIIKDGQLVGYKVFVAIADVSHYVKPGTAVDAEAALRGTSGYPAGMVIPMLPKKLSNDLCSLDVNEDRPVIVGEIDIDLTGEIKSYDIYEAVINVKRNFSYDEVTALHHNEKEALEKDGKFKEAVELLYEIREVLFKEATNRGMVPAEGYDPTVVLNEDKTNVEDFRNDNHIDSHDPVAQLMILFNRVAATVLNKLEIPNILRTHRSPSEKSVERLLMTLKDMGIEITLKGEEIDIKEVYKTIFKKAEKHPLKKEIHSLLIRSMRKADYTINAETGHYALALQDYTHFTSPIRRYADLVEHRLMKDLLNTLKKEEAKGRLEVTNKKLSETIDKISPLTKLKLKALSNEQELYNRAFHLTLCEKKHNEIQNVTSENCVALYMQKFVGRIMQGRITKLDKNHVIVNLFDEKDPAHSDIIEVKVPIKELKHMAGGYYLNESQTGYFTKKKSNTSYKLGDTVQVKIATADPIKREVLGTLNLEKKVEKKTTAELNLES